MEYIVAIKFKRSDGKIGAYLTWGRIFDSLEDTELLEIVKNKFKNLEPRLCRTLQEVSQFPYFYEGLWTFSQEYRPMEGEEALKWKKKKAEEMKRGSDFYLLGYLDKDE